jgi:ABC-2 type transport system permease protein
MYAVLSLPFEHAESIAGWDKTEVLVLISIYYMANGLSWFLFRRGIGEFEDLIRLGNFDGKLIKPVDSAFLVSFFRVDISRLGDFLMAFSFLLFIIWRGDVDINIVRLISAVIAFLAGIFIVLKIFLMVNSLSFWVTQTYLDHVANPLMIVAKYPVDVLPGALSRVFYWVLPIAFFSTVPAAILVGKLPLYWTAVSLIIALGWQFASRWIWNLGLKQYCGVGS